jgi:hypothetical protein
MEANNPELQEKLQDLEHELKVSTVFLKTGDMFWVLSRARVGCVIHKWERIGHQPMTSCLLLYIRRETSLKKGTG